MGAWSNFVAAAKRDGVGNDKEVKCAAIPATALDTVYIEKWSTWNSVTIPGQIVNGIDALLTQCTKVAPDEEGRTFLLNKVCNQLLAQLLSSESSNNAELVEVKNKFCIPNQ